MFHWSYTQGFGTVSFFWRGGGGFVSTKFFVFSSQFDMSVRTLSGRKTTLSQCVLLSLSDCLQTVLFIQVPIFCGLSVFQTACRQYSLYKYILWPFLLSLTFFNSGFFWWGEIGMSNHIMLMPNTIE